MRPSFLQNRIHTSVIEPVTSSLWGTEYTGDPVNDVRKILRSRSSLVSAAVSNTDSIVLGFAKWIG
jgi:hypothetical protein